MSNGCFLFGALFWFLNWSNWFKKNPLPYIELHMPLSPTAMGHRVPACVNNSWQCDRLETGTGGIRRVSAFNLTFLKKFTQYDLKAFSLYLSGFVPIFMGSSPHLASHKRSSLCSVRGTGRVRFLFTTPNQNMFLSELLNLRQRNVHGTVAQGIAFIQPKSRSQARQP